MPRNEEKMLNYVCMLARFQVLLLLISNVLGGRKAITVDVSPSSSSLSAQCCQIARKMASLIFYLVSLPYAPLT
jgi:hypothetical protein